MLYYLRYLPPLVLQAYDTLVFCSTPSDSRSLSRFETGFVGFSGSGEARFCLLCVYVHLCYHRIIAGPRCPV